MRKSFLLLFMLAAGIMQAQAWADPVYTQRGTGLMAGVYYKVMAEQLVRTPRPTAFSFESFRYNYTGTNQYDPLSEKTLNRMMDIAYRLQQASDPETLKPVQTEYNALVTAHLANIDVVTQALSLAREDRRFGDPEFFSWIRQGLLQSILSSGDGSNMFQAYTLMTIGEATALLNALHVQVLKIDNRQQAEMYYTMYEVTDAQHTGPYTIFVNISRPMIWLESQKQTQTTRINIRKQ